MQVRFKRCKDVDKLEKLDSLLFTSEKADGEYDKPTSMWWVAQVNSLDVGFCGLSVYKSDGELTGELLRAGVLPAYRGLGLQRRMIRLRDAAARRSGCTANLTYTADWNIVSANNLVRCGYRLWLPRHPWGVDHALYFWKTL